MNDQSHTLRRVAILRTRRAHFDRLHAEAGNKLRELSNELEKLGYDIERPNDHLTRAKEILGELVNDFS